MKRTFSLFAAIFAIFAFAAPSFALSTSADCAILIEAESGDVIYEQNADARRGPASTTKIMTALIAIEMCPQDRVITVSPDAVGVEGSSAYLYAGEQITMESLLYALMLSSANDAAAAIAYEIAGGIDEFAALMNEKAAQLGLENTHFANPHGLDAPEHYTSARDLATIARTALENETFKKIVSTKKISVPMQSGEATRMLVNHNKLLRMYDDVIGVKTGFTKKCGRTLVSCAERDGVRLIAVTLDDGNDWNDHRNMLDHGFELYERVTLFKAGELSFEASVGTEKITVSNENDIAATVKKDRGAFRIEADYKASLVAPIKKGEPTGEARLYIGDRLIKRVPLVADGDVGK